VFDFLNQVSSSFDKNKWHCIQNYALFLQVNFI